MPGLRGSDRRALALAGFGGFVLLALPSAVELTPWRLRDATTHGPGGELVYTATEPAVLARIAVLVFLGTLVPGAIAILVLLRTRIIDLPRGRRIAVIAVMAVAIGVVRTLALSAGLPGYLPRTLLPAEICLGSAEALVALGLAAYYVDVRRHIRAEEMQRIVESERAARVRTELEHEELRVRREVSQRLHGGLQQRLVVAVIELDAIQRTLEEHGESALARTVHELTATLDTLREREVRGLAHGLYPLAADLDLDDALALLADRLPPSVRLGVGYGPGTRSLLAEGPGPTLAAPDRVALFATVEEGVTNALRHGQAHRIEVAIDAEAEGPGGEGLGHDGDDGPPGDTVVHVTVDDDGAGLPDPAVALSGLVPQRARARRRGGDLMLGPSPLGGVRLDLRLPVHLVRDEVEGLR